MASPRWWLTLAGVALLSLGIRGTPARADVVPGDKINEQNMDKLKDLISPGMEWVIKHGWPITITDEAHRVPAGLQGSDGEVLRPGEAHGRRPQPRQLRRRAAVPERRSEGSPGGHEDHVELGLH